MDFFNVFRFLDLNHLLAFLGIIATAYGYIFIKTSKFIVIKRISDDIVKKANELDIKLNNRKIDANLYHYRCVIFYRGSHDIEKKDIQEPFVIYNESEGCKWHNLKIVKNSTGFKPIIRVKKNKILITNDFFKSGDSLEIDFLLESDNRTIYFEHRILNVSRKQSVYNHDYKSYFTVFIATIFLSLTLFAFIYLQTLSYKSSLGTKPLYLIEYNYLGNILDEEKKWQYYRDLQVDSIYTELLTSKSLSEFKRDSIDLQVEFYSNNGKLTFLHPKSNQVIVIDLPSRTAKSLYEKLIKNQTLRYDYYYKIDDDLKIKFVDSKTLEKFDWTNILLILITTVGFGLSFFASLLNLRNTILVRNAIRNLNE